MCDSDRIVSNPVSLGIPSDYSQGLDGSPAISNGYSTATSDDLVWEIVDGPNCGTAMDDSTDRVRAIDAIVGAAGRSDK